MSKSPKVKILLALWWVVLLYVGAASLVSAIRHPWMTEVEAWMHMDDILMFREISYKEVREKYMNGK